MKRLPESTRASDLILAGHDAQAMHAVMNLMRRVVGLLQGALADPSPLHQQAHRIDGVKWNRGMREFQADRVRRLEAVVDLLEGVL